MDIEDLAAKMPHIKQMQEYIEKYSSFVKHDPQPRSVTGEYVVRFFNPPSHHRFPHHEQRLGKTGAYSCLLDGLIAAHATASS